MSSKNSSSKTATAGKSKAKSATRSAKWCGSRGESKSKTTGSDNGRSTRSESVADRKMMRAWATISENRGDAKRK